MFLEDGDFFLASPAVKHYFIYHSPFRLNYDKVIWKEIGIRKRGEFQLFSGSLGRTSCVSVIM